MSLHSGAQFTVYGSRFALDPTVNSRTLGHTDSRGCSIHTPPRLTLAGPVLDAARPMDLAWFYQRLLGWSIIRSEGPRHGNPDEDGWAILGPEDRSRKIEIQWEPNYRPPTWPSQPGDQLMMVHLDFGVDDIEAAVAWAITCGAVEADHQPQDDVRVMIDPEGHPFCLFPDEP